jgi:hypothetical protein
MTKIHELIRLIVQVPDCRQFTETDYEFYCMIKKDTLIFLNFQTN